MKKLLLFIASFLIASLSFAQSNLPNGEFESWVEVGTPPNNYLNPAGGYFTTLNELATVPVSIGGPGPVTVFQTTDAYAGTYAAKMETKMFESLQILIPGMLGTTKLDMPKQTIHMGKPCVGCKPLRFKGYFKYFPVDGDSCVAQLTLWKFNTNLHKRDTIANVRMIVKDTVDTYTPFDLEVIYSNTTLIPDTMLILFVSSAGFNFNNLMGCVGQIGSTMYVDEVSVEYPAGITEALMPEIDVKTYPNPAADKVIFTLDSCPENLTMEVLDQQGKWITKLPVKSCNLTLNTSSYSSGTYYFRLMQEKHLMSTGVFIVK